MDDQTYESIYMCPECGTEYMISKPLDQYLCMNGHLFKAIDRKKWLRKKI